MSSAKGSRNMSRMFRRRPLLMAAAIAAFVCFALSYSPGRFVHSRQATQRENILYFFAEQTGEPVLCDQISWRVYAHYSLMFAGGGGSYMRSDCYERTAEARQQPSVCWKGKFDPLSISSGFPQDIRHWPAAAGPCDMKT